MSKELTDYTFKRRLFLETTNLPPMLVAGVGIWHQWAIRGVAFWLFVGLALWSLVRAVVYAITNRGYHCTTCGKVISKPPGERPQHGDPIRFYCPDCDIVWSTTIYYDDSRGE